MPNRRTHKNAGIAVGAITATVCSYKLPSHLRAAEIAGGAFGGFIGGILPDIIEPATSPNHRGMAHSYLAGIGGGTLLVSRMTSWQESVRNRPFIEFNDPVLMALEELFRHFVAGTIAGFATGYLSHLALDSQTPRDLPLVG